MKKNLLKLGALAVALVVLFAACAQPAEDSAKSSGQDVIIRLFLDRPASETLKAGDRFQIRAGTKFAIPAYLAEETYSVDVPAFFQSSNGAVPYAAATKLEATRYVWRPRVRNSDDPEKGANVKALIPLARSVTGNNQYADWLIDKDVQDDVDGYVDNSGTPLVIDPSTHTSISASDISNANITVGNAQSLMYCDTDVTNATGALDAVAGTLNNAASAGGFVYVGVGGNPLKAYYFGAEDLSWINDPDVPLLPKVDAIEDILAVGAANITTTNPQYKGKAIFISQELAKDPTWKERPPSTANITGSGNPWFSVLDNYLPQKGTPTNPNNKYYETGVIQLVDGKADTAHGGSAQNNEGLPIVVTKDQYYVDLILINKVIDDPLKGGSLKKSASVYLELEVLSGSGPGGTPANVAIGGMPNNYFYMYTRDKHGFNTWDATNNKWNTDNANIKTVSLKPGINEVYLRYFSSANASDEMGL
jgi:hypothetical protein